MLNLKLRDKKKTYKFSVPGNWSETTYKQYMQFIKHRKDRLKVYEIFTGINREVWNQPHRPELFINLDQQLNFLSEEPTGPRMDIIHRKGVFYDVPKSLLKIPYGKYSDLLTIYRISAGKEEDLIQHIPKMIAIFACLDYENSDELEEIGKEIEEMQTNEIYVLARFFLGKFETLNSGKKTTYRLKKMTQHIYKLVLTVLVLSMGILLLLISSPAATLQSFKIFIIRQWRRFMCGDRYILNLQSVKPIIKESKRN